LENDLIVDSIIDLAGSFAYSVSTAKEAEDFNQLFLSKYELKNWPYGTTYSFNYALGVATRKEFKSLVEVCMLENRTLNILGYKSGGRSSGFIPHDNSQWLEDVVEVYKKLNPGQRGEKYIKLGVDTMVAKQYESKIKAKKISEVLYDVVEGKFSMYIDAVNGLVGPSSYSNLELLYMNASTSIKDYFVKY
jgi:hypothetical protein